MGDFIRLTKALTVTAGAYTAGKCVGGTFDFGLASPLTNFGGDIVGALLRDKAGNNVAYDLALFDSLPPTPADNTTMAGVAADLAACIGIIPFSGIVLLAAGTMGIFTTAGINLPFRQPLKNLYGALVTRGAPTYTGTADVSLELLILPDRT